MNIDLHTHTNASSCSNMLPETLAEKAKEKGLAIVLTDHNTTASWHRVRAAASKQGVNAFLGSEILCTSGGKKAGELLALFIQEEIKAREYFEVIDEVKAQGGLVAVPHPFDILRNNFKYLDKVKGKVDLMEICNSRCYLSSFNEKAEAYAKKNNIPGFAASDAHVPFEVGAAYTIVNSAGEDEDSVKKALVKGNSEVKCGKAPVKGHAVTALSKWHLYPDK